MCFVGVTGSVTKNIVSYFFIFYFFSQLELYVVYLSTLLEIVLHD